MKISVYNYLLFFIAPSLILTGICYCSLSVLYVLISPRPGEGSGGRQQLDQSKLRAFYTITAVLAVLLFRFVGISIGNSLYVLPQLGEIGRCGLWLSVIWMGLPSSLVSFSIESRKTTVLEQHIVTIQI